MGSFIVIISQPFCELGHEPQIMQRRQALVEPITVLKKVVEIAKAVILTDWAITIL